MLIRKKRIVLIITAIICLVNGCSSIEPFRRTELISVANIDPVTVKENFKNRIPVDEYQVLSSVLFEHYFQSFYSLGYLSLDLSKDSFTLVSLDPAGVRLFQITDNAGKIKYSTPIDELEKLSPYVKYIAEDIRNIYFNKVPSENSNIIKKDDVIIFTDLIDHKKIVFTFGGKNNNLLSKQLMGKRSWFWRFFFGEYYSIWQVNYYGYELREGKLYPKNIFYKNKRFGYSITIRLKEII